MIGGGIAALAAATAAVVSQLITNTLVDEALSREEPQIMKKAKSKISGGFADTEIFQQAAEKAEYLLQVPTETVEIDAYDGIQLIGHFYRNPNAKRILIAVHGWRSSWNADFGAVADFWFENGCSVLFIEQRGQGLSAGEYMGFGLKERFDVQSWANFVAEHNAGNLPVYLAGVSMGATSVLMASGLGLPECVHGLMSDCGYTSPRAIWKHVCEDNIHISYGLRQKIVDDMCMQRIDHGAGDYSTTEALAKNTIPVLFVHGTDDGFVPVQMTYENYKACVAPKMLLIVPGADHGLSYFVNGEEYRKQTLVFWNAFD